MSETVSSFLEEKDKLLLKASCITVIRVFCKTWSGIYKKWFCKTQIPLRYAWYQPENFEKYTGSGDVFFF